MKTNILQPDHGASKEFLKAKASRRKKKIAWWVIGVLVFLLAWAGFVAATDITPAKQGKAHANNGKIAFENAQQAMLEQKFGKAKKELKEAEENFLAAQQDIDQLGDLKIIPLVRRQIIAIDKVLSAGVHVAVALQNVCDVGQSMTEVINNDQDVSLNDISPEQKREILKQLYEAPPQLKAAQAEIDLANQAMQEIPQTFLLSQIKDAVQPLQENLPLLKSVIDQAVPLAETFPVIVGYPTEKTYLFLLQNNRELRPTGGFIGTYGILKLKDGEITEFTTDNIYNIDNFGKDKLYITPPEAITKYTGSTQWLMRDSNWSPDFPTSAQKAEEFYHAEGGSEQQIDGTIAVTPSLIESLLTLTGPIEADGITFSSENLFEQLQYQVEFGYARAGISDADRKEVIGTLSTKLMDQLLGMPKSRFPDLWQTFVNNVQTKQILIYLKDPAVQELVQQENWGGEVKSATGDYLLFIDANLAALKTDSVMERSIEHSIKEQDGNFLATTTVHYKNNGSFTDITTRYRTYTRLYIPLGSNLVSAEGYLTTDRLQGGVPTEPSVSEDLGYTVIGGFTAIEPGDEGTLTITYQLPPNVTKQIKEGSYTLYTQKQAGTMSHGLVVDLDIGRAIKRYSPLDMGSKMGDNRVRFETDLSIDREFSIDFK